MKSKAITVPSLRCLLAVLLFAISSVVNFVVFSYVPISLSLPGLTYAWLLELSIFVLAYDMSEVILCLIVPENHLRSLSRLEYHPAVALLYVTCDDFDKEIIHGLRNNTYPDLEVFILDDSQLPESRRILNELGFRVVRRSSRRGYKAGNINNWLFKHGSKYKYFIIADADSVLPDDFVDKMVRVAEHAENRRLAIIESMVFPWNDRHSFVKPLATLAPFQRCRRLRLLNNMNSTLSVGHNNICRTSVLIDIGGFSENYIGEDYATTIEILRRTPCGCKTASVKSYERIPENIVEYARRQSRWAFQTFQLCSLNTGGLPWEVNLALLRALYYYAMPVVAYIDMLWLVGSNLRYWYRPDQYIAGTRGDLASHPAFVFWMSWLIVPVLLRWVLLRREAVPLLGFVRSTFFQAALFFATTWPVILRLAEFRRRARHRFDVTGRSPVPHFLDMLKLVSPGIMLAWITLFSFIPVPRYALLNLVWLVPACLSPFLIYKPGGEGSERQRS